MVKSKEKISYEEKCSMAFITKDEEPYNIPANWVWVMFNSVARIKRGASPRPIKAYITEGDGVNWIKIGDTGEGKYVDVIKEKITEDGAKKSVFVEKGTLLLSNSMSFGRPYILNVDGCIHDGWLAITPSPVVDKEFLYYALLGSEWYFEKVAVGTAVRNLNSDRVASMPIAIPPLEEQYRIVRLIEYMYSRLDVAKEKIQNVIEYTDIRKQAIIHKAFSGELSSVWRKKNGIERKYSAYKLIDVFDFIDYRGKTPNKTNEGVPLITAKNIKKGFLDYSVKEYISKEEYETRKGRGIACKGDILFTTEAPLGNVAIADKEVYSTAQRVIVFHNKNSVECYNGYALIYMLSESFQNELERQKTGSTVAGIKAAKLKNIEIQLPDYNEQVEICNIVNKLLEQEEQIKDNCENILEQIELIKKSVLLKALRGELGTNDLDNQDSMDVIKQMLKE